MFILTGQPKCSRGNVLRHAKLFQHAIPSVQNFVELIGSDMLLCIREFLHSSKNSLDCFKSLMLTNKSIYRFLFESTVLNKVIAKDAFSFNYLRKAKYNLRTYRDLVQFRDNMGGSHLSYNEYQHSQFLKNSKLAFKVPYVHYLRIKIEEQVIEPIHSSSPYCYVRARVPKVQIKRLKHLLTQFEETHSGIAMKIYAPTNNHMPLHLHNNSIWFLAKRQNMQFQMDPFLAGFRVELKLVHFRYCFRLHFYNFSFGVSFSVAERPRRRSYLACTDLLEQGWSLEQTV